jgi:hypothetical protein
MKFDFNESIYVLDTFISSTDAIDGLLDYEAGDEMILCGEEEEVDFKELVVGVIFDSIAKGLEYYKDYAKKKDLVY